MIRVFFASLVAAGAFVGAAAANEIEDQCTAYAVEYDGDASGCACLGQAAESDDALAAAIALIETPEDVEAADDATKAAIAACWPSAGQ